MWSHKLYKLPTIIGLTVYAFYPLWCLLFTKYIFKEKELFGLAMARLVCDLLCVCISVIVIKYYTIETSFAFP